jgi:hypothetical protein
LVCICAARLGSLSPGCKLTLIAHRVGGSTVNKSERLLDSAWRPDGIANQARAPSTKHAGSRLFLLGLVMGQEPPRARNAGLIRPGAASTAVLPDKAGVPECRFRERLDGKGVVTHEDHEPLRNGRARSPLRAADAVNVASSRGAHGVTRPTGNGRFRESPKAGLSLAGERVE